MKNRLLLTVAAIAVAITPLKAELNAITNMPEGTTWETFIHKIAIDPVALGTFVTALELSSLDLTPGEGVAAWIADPTSAKLFTAVTNESGSGVLVGNNTPTIISPVISTGLTASGSAANTFVGSTGTFITSTGANTLSGAVTINAATTPSLTLATGKTNTGFIDLLGKTSGGLRLIPADTGSLVTVTNTAQTVGTTTLTIPDFANVADTFAFITLAQELSSKTLVAPVIKTGLTASGSASNTFASSTGAFVTSTGANTLSGDTTLAAGKDFTYGAGDGKFDGALGTGIFTSTSGLNTFSGKAAFKTITTPVAATGTDLAGAAAIGSANIVYISSDGASKGVKMISGAAGDIQILINTSSTAALLYPIASTGAINGIAAQGPVTVPASKGLLIICSAAGTWTAFDLPALASGL